MQFNVAGLMKERTGATRQYEVNEDIEGLFEDVTAEAPLTGAVKLIRTGEGVLVMGELDTAIEMECERCLQAFTAPVHIELEEEFRPSIDIVTGASLPLAEDQERETLIDEHHILDLTEVLRQDILLAAPLAAICREDCAGLCPQCGQNLNEGPCDCTTEDSDPRWEALEQLR